MNIELASKTAAAARVVCEDSDRLNEVAQALLLGLLDSAAQSGIYQLSLPGTDPVLVGCYDYPQTLVDMKGAQLTPAGVWAYIPAKPAPHHPAGGYLIKHTASEHCARVARDFAAALCRNF